MGMIRVRTLEGNIADINSEEICAVEMAPGVYRIGLTSGHYYELLPVQYKRVADKLKVKVIRGKK